jgi:hypothetical protein
MAIRLYNYISYLAKRRRLPVAGENAYNPGRNTPKEMAICVDRARTIPVAVMFRMAEIYLWSGTNATMADYACLIRQSPSNSARSN